LKEAKKNQNIKQGLLGVAGDAVEKEVI